MPITVQTFWRPSSLVVGDEDVAQHLKSLFPALIGSKFSIKTDFEVERGNARTVYVRDQQVCRLDGSILIPYGIQDVSEENFLGIFRSLLPETSAATLAENGSGLGNGFQNEDGYKGSTRQHPKKTPFTLGKSVIEGGNCLLFQGEHGRGKGVVGVHSLILTLLALEERNYLSSPAISDKLVKQHSQYQDRKSACAWRGIYPTTKTTETI